jgi:dolichol-phosphate mannosyltransferase
LAELQPRGPLVRSEPLRAGKPGPYPWANELEKSGIDLSIAVPCYNEQDNIVGTLESIVAAVKDVGCTYEIIVIDDCSPDETSRRIEQYQAQHPDIPVRLHRNRANRGFARGFFDGAFMARGRYFRLICGDNVESVETIRAIVEQMGKKDLVLPYHSAAVGRGALRLALSSWFTTVVNLVSGRRLHYYNGCGLFRTIDVMRWHVETTGFGFQAEFVTRMLDLGATYVEVPVTARERMTGKSRALTLRNFMSAAYTMLKIGLRRVRRALFKDKQIDLG